jgi:hypothetical protein
MKLKIKPNYVLAWVVRGKKKYKGFYTPQKKSWAEYFDLVPVWIAQIGEGENSKLAHEGVKVGSKCVIIDAFELEPLPFDDWSSYPCTEECLVDAEEYEVDIEMNILHEDSLIGVVEP